MPLFCAFTIAISCFTATKSLSVSSTVSSVASSIRTMSKDEWQLEAANHVKVMKDLLYPKVSSTDSHSHYHYNNHNDKYIMKKRLNAVKNNPIYNFLHTYYRYSASDLMLYSPGMYVTLLDIADKSNDCIHKKFLQLQQNPSISTDSHSGTYVIKGDDSVADGRYGWIKLSRNRDILFNTINSKPNYNCYGLHEWAMLYSTSGNGSSGDQRDRHQSTLELRVNQSVINHVVETSKLTCTHFDAFRFFHTKAQSYNTITPLTRSNQIEHEQPACIHACMDLFKYAYELHPLINSRLLQQALRIALKARLLDMAASPYLVKDYIVEHDDMLVGSSISSSGCIPIETAEGRKEYVILQENLYKESQVIRKELYQTYCNVLNHYC